MKKFMVSFLIVLAAVGAASATVRQGQISYANMNAEEYVDFISESLSDDVYAWHNYKVDEPEYAAYISTMGEAVTFDSLAEMIMALDAGKIDRIELQQPVADYFFKMAGNNEKYMPYIISRGVAYYLSMGFNKDSKWFEPFSEAINAMDKDKTL